MTTRLTDAFRIMRSAGLIARQNYLCCSSCAGAQIATDVEDRINKNPDVETQIRGTCFYHRQDAAALDRCAADATMMLRFGSIHTELYGVVGLFTDEVGQIVCRALREAGIRFEWDGNPDRCIEIYVADAVAEALPKPAPVGRLPRRTSPRQLASQAQRQAAVTAAAQGLLAEVDR